MSKVSVILPTYNESGNIVELVTEIGNRIPQAWDHEIIVIDDNSPDGTCELVRRSFGDDPQVVPVLRTTDRGLAKSIRAGIEAATGDQVVVMDTDFTHDPVEIPRLLHVGKMYDIVSGSRFCPGGNMQDTRHYLASMAFNLFLRIILRTQVQDNLGGYFTMSRARVLQLPLDRIFYGYGEYYFRLIHYGQAAGMSIVEIPAVYKARTQGASKSRFLRMLFTYSLSAVRMRIETLSNGCDHGKPDHHRGDDQRTVQGAKR
ncbi:MAG: Undecaprenyl-phosphate mannosyltransferase [Deltaproteobacteria bacterium ADurb.BinA179]|jgi:dolichol-phosphate mannosyltransferase|nr:glycosyltransferase [Deltaproteobacteria bacterium]OPZ27591.1 MAG: Undecaprenyl-phosphate mannosyltransferase [Deltaproteobacteria bacterium ADurb.BinA179]NMD39759.1 glycosyltransferase [Deltaproteobacteria bacterium]HOC76168.1 glycosyltransferase [Deltaproteobacteria bacterium]HPA75517.1 glycosyltransferase [Deltaproteobacteria bacterium]